MKKMLLEIPANSQGNICVFSKTQVFVCIFCEIIKNTFLHGAPPVAASDNCLAYFV